MTRRPAPADDTPPPVSLTLRDITRDKWTVVARRCRTTHRYHDGWGWLLDQHDKDAVLLGRECECVVIVHGRASDGVPVLLAQLTSRGFRTEGPAEFAIAGRNLFATRNGNGRA
jgi:hypothetical protein